MAIFIFGINHKTAPVSLRGKTAFPVGSIVPALLALQEHPLVSGNVIISTCNRTELYISSDSTITKEEICHWLCDYKKLDQKEIEHAFYWYQGKQAIIHLMKVAAGLDSMILGEPQILGQVKKSYSEAQIAETLTLELERLFQKSFHVAKRIRTETAIGSLAVSVAFAACLLARRIFTSMADVTILVMGAGDTSKLVLNCLKYHKVKKLIVANRTPEHGKKLAELVDVTVEVIPLEEIVQHLSEVDLVFSAVASQQPLLHQNDLEPIMRTRHNKPMMLIDMAVPPNIDVTVGKCANTYLYSVDDLETMIKNNLGQRQKAVAQAEMIIAEESEQLIGWLRVHSISNVIRSYREQAVQAQTELVERALYHLQYGHDAREVIQVLAHKLSNRLLHEPTQSLHQAAKEGDWEKLDILCASLGLDPKIYRQ